MTATNMSSEYVPYPLDHVQVQRAYRHQQATMPEAYIESWEAYGSQLFSIYTSIQNGWLPAAAGKLVPLSEWLVKHATELSKRHGPHAAQC